MSQSKNLNWTPRPCSRSCPLQPLPTMSKASRRHYPVGAEINQDGVHFRVWAPSHKSVAVVLSTGDSYPLRAEGNGYFSGTAPAKKDSLYKFLLDSGQFPDPASRFQPEGPFGWSQVVDPSFPWTDQKWPG